MIMPKEKIINSILYIGSPHSSKIITLEDLEKIEMEMIASDCKNTLVKKIPNPIKELPKNKL